MGSEPANPGVSIVIPAWNEEDRLARTLERYLPALEARGEPFEIIVVADGVRDRTAEVATRFANLHVRVLEFPTRLGKGGAIVEGFKRARYDKAGFVDADSPIPISEALRLLDRLDRHDGVIASRGGLGQRGRFHGSTGRHMLSVGWNLLAKALFLTRATDTQCGTKFFRTRELAQILPKVTIRGWAFDLCLLYHWRKAGFSCQEVVTSWRDPPGSKLAVGKAVPIMLASIIALRLVNSPLRKVVPERTGGQLRRGLELLFTETRTAPRERNVGGVVVPSQVRV